MTIPVQTRLLHAPGDIPEAAELLRGGALVAFPTETVYGLGADARNGAAVARVFEAKRRPAFNPLIAHVADVGAARRLVVWTQQAQRLADAFWPGPLSLVLRLREGHGLSALVTAGLSTVAVRVPDHPVALALLRQAGTPVAAPSANPSGRISPTSAAHVMAGLAGRIDAVLDGGPCAVGLESTIVGLEGAPVLLRPGGVAGEEIEAALGTALRLRDSAEPLNAPGQTRSHYAPASPLRLNALAARGDEVLLGFGDIDGVLNLSRGGDLVEAAANLFEHLHRLDRMRRPIAVAPIPAIGLGVAINDRLARAAAPRPGEPTDAA